MPTLEPPHTHHLSAAIGWLELGNAEEASIELAQIPSNYSSHPDVLEVRWRVCADAVNWSAALAIARALLESHPDRVSGWIHQAYSLRRLSGHGLLEAWRALLPAADLFPEEPVIAYNLACYACQLGEMNESLQWLQRAVKAGDKSNIKAVALADPDLKPLWRQIAKV